MKSRTYHPQIEMLEDRRLPTGVGYLGGHLLSNVEVNAVYFGPDWTANPVYQQRSGQLNTFLTEITNSPYMDMLNEYSVGRGAFNGADYTTDAWNLHSTLINGSYHTTIDDADITTMLRNEIAAGILPGPDANRLYVVYVAPNVVVTQGGASSIDPNPRGFAGYHNYNFDLFKGTLYYAVIVDPTAGGVPAPARPGYTDLQDETTTTSHELAEACTDADTIFGWRDRNAFSTTYGQEIGDITDSIVPIPQSTGYIGDGFAVQGEWSNLANGSILWGTNFTVSSGILYLSGDQEWWNASDTVTVDQNVWGNVWVALNGVTVGFDPGTVTAISISVGQGDDTIAVDNTAAASVYVYLGSGMDSVSVAPDTKDLTSISNLVSVIGGSGNGSLNVNDQGNPWNSLYQVSSTTVNRFGRGTIYYQGIRSLSLFGGTGFNSVSITGTAAASTIIDPGSGTNIVVVSPVARNLDNFPAPLTVLGHGNTQLDVNDQNNPDRVLTQDFVTGTSVTRLGQSIDPLTGRPLFYNASINYSGVSGLTLSTGAFPTLVQINSTATTTTLIAGPGTAVVEVGADSHNLDSIPGDLTIHGNGSVPLIVDDQNNGNLISTQDTLTGTDLTRVGQTIDPRTGWPVFHVASIHYSAVGSLVFGTGSLLTFVFAESTTCPTTLNAGPGTALVAVSPQAQNLDNLRGGLTIHGNGAPTLVVDDRGNAGAHTYTLTGTSVSRTGAAALTYDGIAKLTVDGSGGANAFMVSSLPATTTVTLGGSGADALTGPDAATVWTLTGPNAGNWGTALQFSGMKDLVGGSANDTFQFTGSGSIAGTVRGGAGTNQLDYSALAGPVRVNLQSRSAAAIGGGAKAGFTDIQSLVGSQAGTDTLTGPNAATVWTISSLNGGLAGAVAFTGFENLAGGSGVDIFTFLTSGNISGSLNGGHAPSHKGNWLDYSPLASPVTVNLQTGAGSGVAGGAAGKVRNIQNVHGGNGGNTLTGNGLGNILIGGTGADTIVGGPGPSLLIGDKGADHISGGSGGDILIGDATSNDSMTSARENALMSILAEWQSADSYDTRFHDINLGRAYAAGSHLNGNNRLLFAATVKNDSAADTVTATASAQALDWFFQGAGDILGNQESGEHVNNT